jgi:hypothetical protein
MSTPKKKLSEKKTLKASANLSSSTKNTDNFRIELTSLQKPVENFLKVMRYLFCTELQEPERILFSYTGP